MVLDDLLRRSARHWAGHDAIREPGRTVTFAALADEVDTWAARLAGLGVAPGDRVGVASRNRIEYAALYFAVARVGGVAVALNWRLLPGELLDQIVDARAVVLLADAATAQVLDPRRAQAPTVRTWIDLDGGTAGWSAPEGIPLGAPAHAPGATDVCVQMYTSGTTGRSKGAMLTHENLCQMVLSWSVEMPLRGGQTRFLQVTPLFHVGGLMMVLLNVTHGSTLLLEPEFQPGSAVRRLQAERATHALLVPAMLRWMMLDPAIRGAVFPALELILYGAAPFAPEHLVSAMTTFGCRFLQAYGLTETAGVVTALTPEDHTHALQHQPALLESCGRPMIGCEIRVVGTDGAPVPDGTIGEVLVRGPNVFAGYWDRPADTAAALRDGWLWSGDVGRQDARGYLTIVDRSKDMILVGGENVYPSEIEAVLVKVAGVRDVAVIGIPHDVWGESVFAVVVAAPEADVAALPQQIIDHARVHLARFKCPTRVALVAELPRTPAGKVQKAVLRAPYWEGRSRQV